MKYTECGLSPSQLLKKLLTLTQDEIIHELNLLVRPDAEGLQEHLTDLETQFEVAGLSHLERVIANHLDLLLKPLEDD